MVMVVVVGLMMVMMMVVVNGDSIMVGKIVLDISTISWGIGVMLGMMVSGGVSGGHLNPAITVAVASLGKIPWWKVTVREEGGETL